MATAAHGDFLYGDDMEVICRILEEESENELVNNYVDSTIREVSRYFFNYVGKTFVILFLNPKKHGGRADTGNRQDIRRSQQKVLL